MDRADLESIGEASIDITQKCPICLGAWTNVGEHRLCSLRCGHLFGFECIKQWLNSDNESAKKCPQCNAKASAKQIRFIYANKVTCLDNRELEKIKNEMTELSKALSKQKRKTKKYKQICRAKAAAMLDSDFESD